MSKLARVTLPQALGYRGGQPMTAWLLHRISAIGIVLFVSMHVFAAFFLYATTGGSTNAIANGLTNFYESLPVQIFVLFCVLYHATNGLRIVILDMWPGCTASTTRRCGCSGRSSCPCFSCRRSS